MIRRVCVKSPPFPPSLALKLLSIAVLLLCDSTKTILGSFCVTMNGTVSEMSHPRGCNVSC